MTCDFSVKLVLFSGRDRWLNQLRGDFQLPAQKTKSHLLLELVSLVFVSRMFSFEGPLAFTTTGKRVAFTLAGANAPKVFGELFRSAVGHGAQTEHS